MHKGLLTFAVLQAAAAHELFVSKVAEWIHVRSTLRSALSSCVAERVGSDSRLAACLDGSCVCIYSSDNSGSMGLGAAAPAASTRARGSASVWPG